MLRYNTFGSSGVQINPGDNSPTSAGFTVVGNYFPSNAPCGLSNTSYAYNITPTGENTCGGTGSQSFSASSLHAGFVDYRPYAGDQGDTPGSRRLPACEGKPTDQPGLDRQLPLARLHRAWPLRGLGA